MDTSTFWEKTKTVCRSIWNGIKFLWGKAPDWLRITLGIVVLWFLVFTCNDRISNKHKGEAVQTEEQTAQDICKNLYIAYYGWDTLALATMQRELKDKFPDDTLNDSVAKYLELARSEFAEFNKENEAAFHRLKESKDEFDKITWYKNPYFTHNAYSNHISAYIGKKGENIWMRIYVTYTGGDWIFFDDIQLKVGNGTISIPFNKYEKKTGVSGGTVFESIDVEGTSYLMTSLHEIGKNGAVSIRLKGDRQKTWTLSSSEIKGLNDITSAYLYLLSTGCKGEELNY